MTSSKTQASLIDRRRFLEYTWCGVGVSLSLALLPGHEILASPRFGDDPFTLGVASGDPTDDGIVLWTRLAPEPGNPDVLGRSFVPVRWRVATDSRMRHVVARGTAVAAPQLAHSVHVEVNGLQPGRDYFYQFDARREDSRVGHFRTAPREHEMLRETRFAFVTCQDWPSGYYIAYRDMLQNDLDLVFHLGDYTYEYAIEGTLRRSVGRPRRGRPSPDPELERRSRAGCVGPRGAGGHAASGAGGRRRAEGGGRQRRHQRAPAPDAPQRRTPRRRERG